MPSIKRKSTEIKTLANEFERLNIMIDDTKIQKDKRDEICEIVVQTIDFRMNCISLVCNLSGSVGTINFAIKHIEHKKQQKIYQEQMTKLCEKDYKEIDHLIEFKITKIGQEYQEYQEYADIISTINQCTCILTSISQIIETIKKQYMEKKDVTEIGPMIKQLEESLTALYEQIDFSCKKQEK